MHLLLLDSQQGLIVIINKNSNRDGPMLQKTVLQANEVQPSKEGGHKNKNIRFFK
jgi:hypothetical protein